MPGTEFEIEADLVLLAMGFTGPVKSKLLVDIGVALDAVETLQRIMRIARACPESSPPVMPAAVRRSSSGQFAKGETPLKQSTPGSLIQEIIVSSPRCWGA